MSKKTSDIPLIRSRAGYNALHQHCWNITIVSEHVYDSCPCLIPGKLHGSHSLFHPILHRGLLPRW